MMKKLLLILFCLPFIGVGQIWETELLKNNKDATFLEKKIAFENYRTKYPDKKGYNPYARLIDFLETRIDKDGKYPLDKLYREWKKEKEKYTNSNSFSFSNWEELASYSEPRGAGRINTIEFDPIDSNIIWIGAASGGLWKTIDGGSNWTTNTDDLPVISISAITINPSNTQEMLIATGDPIQGAYTSSIGVLRSIDGGISWDTTGLNETVYDLEMNPNHSDSIFAGTITGIMLSIDGGINWNVVYSIPSGGVTPNTGLNMVDLEFMPGNTDVIYAAARMNYGSGDSSPYRSIDGGVTWAVIDSGLLPGRYNIEIAVTNDNPNVIYAVFADGNDYHGLYKSSNMGDSWILQSDSPNILVYQAWYNLSLAVDPTNESNVFVGGKPQKYSPDNGQNWFPVFPGHADQHYAKFNPLNNSLFFANDGGIYKYSAYGDTLFFSNGFYIVSPGVINMNSNLRIGQFYKLGLSATNPDKLVGGTQDNGTQMFNNSTLSRIYGADGMECAIDQLNENKIFVCTQYGGLRRNDDISDPSSPWNNISPVNYLGEWVTPYKLHPINNNMIVAGYDAVYRSFDSGDNWDSISPSWGSLKEIALAPSDTDYIYAGKGISIRVTKDGGISWSNWTSPYSAVVTDIVVAPYDPETIWVTVGEGAPNQKVFKSTDAGISWVNISGNNLPDIPVHSIVYQDNAKHNLYIGTDLGVYHRDSTMSDWMPFMTGLPNVAVTELEIQYGVNKIRAATYGRGIWESYCATAFGCTDTLACNYDSTVTIDNGSCIFSPSAQINQIGLSLAIVVSSGLGSPYTFLWNTTETTDQITPSMNGVYWCLVSDVNSCVSDTIFFDVTNIISAIHETENINRRLLKITNVLDQEIIYRKNSLLFYLYDDGTVEKRIVIE